MSVKNTGFPSPAEEYREGVLSLDQHIIQNPSSTFFMKMDSDAMAPLVHKGDLLVIDRSLIPESGKLIVGHHRGEFLLRKILIKGGKRYLQSKELIDISEDDDFTIFGVVSWVVHKMN